MGAGARPEIPCPLLALQPRLCPARQPQHLVILGRNEVPSTVLSELFTPPLGIEPESRQTATELGYIPVALHVLFVFCYLVLVFETRNHFVTQDLGCM